MQGDKLIMFRSRVRQNAQRQINSHISREKKAATGLKIKAFLKSD